MYLISQMKNLTLLFFLVGLMPSIVMAQSGTIRGKVFDRKTNAPLAFANVVIIELNAGTLTEEDGSYSIPDIKPGFYTIEYGLIGYKPEKIFDIEVQSSKPTLLDIRLTEEFTTLTEVVVQAEAFKRSAESPVSLRTIGVSEIKRNPGGNRDISRVIQSLPGVTSTASFRNDLIIRGGAPNENRFFIDDIEVPNINHFATQGASGGPAGIINVDFIREVDFFSGAFPANRYNALSSVFNFKFKDGRDDRIGTTLTLGANDLGITLDGPVHKNGTLLVSARRSYLQFLFDLIGLPFLPTYNDFQIKYKYKINPKTELNILGIGAIDRFKLNLDADDTENKQFLLENLPINNQWNYAFGISLKRYRDNGFGTFVISRNMLDNSAIKYFKNDESNPDNKILDYNAQEIENKARWEEVRQVGSWNLSFGTTYEYAQYRNRTFNRIFIGTQKLDINFESDLAFHKYGAFVTASKKYLDERLEVTLGSRFDGNSFNSNMSNPLTQWSPRISLSYFLSPKWSLNANWGIFYQLPPYTTMGYRENDQLTNLDLSYIRNNQSVFGIAWSTSTSARLSIEGYYKDYSGYPFLLIEGISLANLGGDFGVVGNGPAVSTNEGRAYGVEILYQQRLYKGFYGIASYTFGKSEFRNIAGVYLPSAWDARHIANLTIGKRLGRDWEIGVKYRYQSGLPLTPFENDANLVEKWDRNNRALPDYTRLNTLRNPGFGFLDMRIDKKWFFKKWDLNFYLDLQNITQAAVPQTNVVLDRPLDDTGRPIGGGIIQNPTAPIAEQRYLTKEIRDEGGNLLPIIGLVISF